MFCLKLLLIAWKKLLQTHPNISILGHSPLQGEEKAPLWEKKEQVLRNDILKVLNQLI